MNPRRPSAMIRFRHLLVAWLVCALGVLPLAGYAQPSRTQTDGMASVGMSDCDHVAEARAEARLSSDASCCCCNVFFHQSDCDGGCTSVHLNTAMPSLPPATFALPLVQWEIIFARHPDGFITAPPFHPPKA